MQNGFPSVLVIASFELSADSEAAGLDGNLDFVRTESGDFCARDDVVAGFQYVNLHRVQQLRLRSEPIVPVVAVRAVPALKEFVRAPCDQIEQILRVFK